MFVNYSSYINYPLGCCSHPVCNLQSDIILILIVEIVRSTLPGIETQAVLLV
jgi:hypothetical protein